MRKRVPAQSETGASGWHFRAMRSVSRRPAPWRETRDHKVPDGKPFSIRGTLSGTASRAYRSRLSSHSGRVALSNGYREIWPNPAKASGK